MNALPSGTVTLLFSDMESSTQMVHALGSVWPDVLDAQRMVCRDAWAAHGGHELGTEGDSFFVVFDTAPAAVVAAVEAQRALATRDWPDGVEVRVRMGIHSGSPQRHGEGYVGMDVHRAARVAAAAHGGQVLVSEVTSGLAEGALGEAGRWIDLGEHQLKDVPGRTRLFQASAPGLGVSFPPVRTVGAAGALPGLSADLVGRETEVADVQALLRDGHRLVSLTGPGGTGKTTLSLAVAAEVADAFPDGVFALRLAGVRTEAGMWAALSQVLDVPADGHVPPGFFTYVAHRRVLLVLDNLEQIDGADTVVRALLGSAAHVVVVATSRRPLHVAGEREYAVTPLGVAASRELFVQHAVRVRRGFALTDDNTAAIDAICAALDGLPLAVEIAAARSKLMSPQAILARIDTSLDLASTDRSREARQATVRGAIAWSYDLLGSPHRSVLGHLGVFVGGASYDALEAVLPSEDLGDLDLMDVLFDLVDASLVTTTDAEDGEPRFGLLETVRRFALDRLESEGLISVVFSRHAQWVYDLLRSHRGRSTEARMRLFAALAPEIANIDVMVERGAPGVRHVEMYGDADVAPLHAIALAAVAMQGIGRFVDCLSWVRVGLARAAGDGPHVAGDDLVLRALGADVSRLSGDLSQAASWAREAWAGYESLRDAPSPPLPEWMSPTAAAARAAMVAGVTALFGRPADNPEPAHAWLARLGTVALSDDTPLVSLFLGELGYTIADSSGDLSGARDHLVEMVDLLTHLGWERHEFENNLADVDLQLGRRAAAQRRLSDAAAEFVAMPRMFVVLIAAETMAAAVGPEHPLMCARVYGCTSVTRVVEALANDAYGDAEDERVLAEIRPLVDEESWDRAWEQGRGESVIDLFLEMAALPLPSLEDS